MTIPWWVYGILGASLWGLHLNLISNISSHLPPNLSTPLTIYLIPNALLVFLVPLFFAEIVDNFKTIANHPDKSILIQAGVSAFTSILASFCLYFALQQAPNATVASLVDVSYPIFVLILAAVIFGQNHLTPGVAIGSALIFAGLFVVILTSS